MEGIVSTAVDNGKLWGTSAADWANIQELTCVPVYVAALERLGVDAGVRYLDAGCGAGMAAHMAYERGAKVYGLDAAENLLAIARERTPGATFVAGKLEALPYEDAMFDCVTGFNSFQYAANPVRALAEARRVVCSGGKILVMTWGEPEGMPAASLVAALKPLLPAPPPGAPGPFALSNTDALHKFAVDAGLRPVEVFDVDSPWKYSSLEEALRGLRSSGVAARAVVHAGREAVDAAHAKALEPFKQANGSYCIGATFRCLIAEA